MYCCSNLDEDNEEDEDGSDDDDNVDDDDGDDDDRLARLSGLACETYQ